MRTAVASETPKLSWAVYSTRFATRTSEPAAYPKAQPLDETASRSSGGAIWGR